jgi:hypothetical protein
MSCSHGRDQYNCVLCSQEKTQSLVAQHAQITERASAEQSAFINEQRSKTNLREAAEDVRSEMRHNYLKLVREGKNKMVDFGNGEVKLDAADIELYWTEYRESQFAYVEQIRVELNNQLNGDIQNLNNTAAITLSNMRGPNIGIITASFLILFLSVGTKTASGSIIFGFALMALTYAGVLGVSIARKGMPASQREWIPRISIASPAAALAFSIGVGSVAAVPAGALMFYAKKIRSAALLKNKDVIACQNTIARTRQEINNLLSPDVMTAIRRLG